VRTPLVVANWKMNLGLAEAKKYLAEFLPRVSAVRGVQVALAPQSPLLSQLVQWTESTLVQVAAQNSGTDRAGAYTAEISPLLLKELAVKWVILGHSERRHVFGETDSIVQARLRTALKEGLWPILCVGETLEQRRAGQTLDTIQKQLEILQGGTWVDGFDFTHFAVAYEPVWAIGTGETASAEQAQEVHRFIRQWLQGNLGEAQAETIRIQYGGSVKPENAGLLMAQKDVDGLLVGSASLKPEVFAEIVKNAVQSGSDWKKDKEKQ
jgi:triosephosphate isomerase (TIM)